MNRKHPLYRTIHNMKTRCYYPAHRSYLYYGGRGITVCLEWREDMLSFVKWGIENGWKPGLQIDRINNDGPYSPENCRFVTLKENVRNSRSTKLSIKDIQNIKYALSLMGFFTHQYIADCYGVHRSTVTRIHCGLRHVDV